MRYKRCGLYYQESQVNERILDPNVIAVPHGYQVEVFAEGMDTPISMVFDENDDLLVADSGYTTDEPKVLRVRNDTIEVVADNFTTPITGINQLEGHIYVSHRGCMTVLNPDGSRNDIISGLPSFGDHINNRVEFGPDNKIYFGQGTATNSGIVGIDNDWIRKHPYFCDIPGSPIILKRINYQTANLLNPASGSINTGAFSPFGTQNLQHVEMVIGNTRASGSIMRANLDGSGLELLAWGLRDPVKVIFDRDDRLLITNDGMDNRGSRPIANAPDTLEVLVEKAWYGWPDFVAGESVASPRFTPIGGIQPSPLLETIPSVPPRPIATFSAGSNIMGFDINYNSGFGPTNHAYVASFGRVYYEGMIDFIRSGVGHRINQVNLTTGEVTTFAINTSGFTDPSGLGRPTDVVFGPDGAMYVSDFAYDMYYGPNVFPPGQGVIWKISRSQPIISNIDKK